MLLTNRLTPPCLQELRLARPDASSRYVGGALWAAVAGRAFAIAPILVTRRVGAVRPAVSAGWRCCRPGTATPVLRGARLLHLVRKFCALANYYFYALLVVLLAVQQPDSRKHVFDENGNLCI